MKEKDADEAEPRPRMTGSRIDDDVAAREDAFAAGLLVGGTLLFLVSHETAQAVKIREYHTPGSIYLSMTNVPV